MSKSKIQESLDSRTHGDHVTGTPVGEGKWAQDVRAITTFSTIGSDTVDSFDASANTITAASHAAKIGDRIRFTSGALNTLEFSVYAVTTNTIVVGEDFSTGPSAADAFSILRPTSQAVSAGGGTTAALTFTYDGADQVVTEDTGTPANNRPLPVKLTGLDGDVVINSSNLNLEVQLDHDSANPDSVRIGDGTETANVNASNELQVADDTARTSLATIAGDTTSLDTKVPAQGAALTAASLPVNIASDQTVPVSDAGGSLTVDGTVDIGSALPAGTNNIGDVDVLTLPDVTQSTHDNLNANVTLQVGDVDVANGNPVPVSDAGGSLTVDGSVTASQATHDSLNANANLQVGDADVANGNPVPVSDAGGSLTVDVGTALPAGTNNIGEVESKPGDVVDFIDTTPLLDTSSTNIPASASTPVTIVASLAAAVREIHFNETTGSWIGLYSDPAGAAVLEAVFPPGVDTRVPCELAASTVLGLRNMENATISSGFVSINFIG